MICILIRDPISQEIVDWLMAVDCAHARRQADASGATMLAQLLYRMEGPLEHTLPPQQDLPLPGPRYTMLVS